MSMALIANHTGYSRQYVYCLAKQYDNNALPIMRATYQRKQNQQMKEAEHHFISFVRQTKDRCPDLHAGATWFYDYYFSKYPNANHFTRRSAHRWLVKQGICKQGKRKKTIHRLRQRRMRRCEMLQIDCCVHDWVPGLGNKITLMVFIDDATSELVYCKFIRSECIEAYQEGFVDYICENGVPLSVYSDGFSGLFSNHKDKDLRELTDIGIAFEKLGITHIRASTPQARGRVERAHKTLQDKLGNNIIVALKQSGLKNLSISQAIDFCNQVLAKYMQDHNQRFSVQAQEAEDAHIACSLTRAELEEVFSCQVSRKMSKNQTFSLDNCLYQITDLNGNGAYRANQGMQIEIVYRCEPGERTKRISQVLLNNKPVGFALIEQQPKLHVDTASVAEARMLVGWSRTAREQQRRTL